MLLLSSFELSVFMFLFYDSQFTIFVHLQSYEWKKTRGLSCSKRKFSGLFNFGNYALSGASFISTGIHITLVVAIATLCQCPEWATFISIERAKVGANPLVLCQCPEWGDLHFYFDTFAQAKRFLQCVNALKGATSISTLASGNPHK